jgi:hypothetical protein
MKVYVMEIRKLENKFLGMEILHVVWDNNVGLRLGSVALHRYHNSFG